MTPRCRGFSLLELLVALVIFAVISAIVYGGLHSVMAAREQTAAQAQRLRDVQGAVLLLEHDLEEAVRRPIRDEYGDSQAALLGQSDGEVRLALTRGGVPNPTGAPRSDLQRVAYRLKEETLSRLSWRVLDRAQDSTPYEADLLDGVESFHLRFLDHARQWSEDWPPPNLEPGQDAGLPLAVEVSLEVKSFGKVVRLLPLPEGSP